MLTELKRCNSIGSIEGLLFLVKIIAGKKRISKAEIRNRCALESGISVHCPGAVAFLEYLGLVTTTVETVTPSAELVKMSELKREKTVDTLVRYCITHLVEDGIFDKESLGFDAEKGCMIIKRSSIPLAYAAIRNFLTVAGALGKEGSAEICITDTYEEDFVSGIQERRKKTTLEQLLKQQEEQSKRGREAEEFILRLEKERLPNKSKRIKRISDFDVAAGYDIVSFADTESTSYDRFVEVKCYLGNPHFFWSENESDVAKIKGDKYVLCLVDYSRINEPDYVPDYFRDPYKTILENESWLVTTSSFKIQKV